MVFIVIAITRRPKEYRPEVPQETEEQEETAAALTKEMEELASELSAKTEEQERMREHYRLFIEQFPVSENDGGSVQLLAELKAKAMEYRSLSERETERKEQRRTLREEMQSLHRAIDGFLRGIDEKYGAEEKLRASYDMLHEDVREYEWLTAELDKSEKELESFQESNPEIDFKEETAQGADDAEGTEELQQQEKQLEEEIEAVNEKISSYRKDLDAVCVIADTQADVEEELEGLKTELAEAEYKADVLEKTLQYLREAKESFSTHYMGAMRRGFEKYASMLGGKQRVYLDVQLEAQIEAGGARKGSEYFSTGNRDFIGICTRLALVDALFEKEKPFLILDDPFVNLDDEKVAHAGELLEKLAEEYQILYLICHSSRRIQEKR